MNRKGTMSKGKTKPDPFRSRIVGEGQEAPDQLLANPRNWRVHPKEQVDALDGLLSQVGWVQRVIVNRTTGHVVDGHARVALALRRDEPAVPVLYVELSEAEEALVLAALDPIAGMAGTDQAMLDELLADVEANSEALHAMLQSVAGRAEEVPLPSLDDGDRDAFQQMTFTVHDDQKRRIDAALAKAKGLGAFVGPNENSNGNALARICDAFL